MKILICALLAVVAIAAEPASAQWRHNGGHFGVQQQRPSGPPGGYYQRPQRDYRPDYRQPDYRQPDRRDGRMTEEERRDLRRDLDRANREIYKGRR